MSVIKREVVGDEVVYTVPRGRPVILAVFEGEGSAMCDFHLDVHSAPIMASWGDWLTTRARFLWQMSWMQEMRPMVQPAAPGQIIRGN